MTSVVLSLDDAKRQLRLTDDADDALVEAAIAAAIDHAERFTDLVIGQREVLETASGFGGRLATWPVREVSGVAYRDAAGVEQQLPTSAWWANVATRPLRLNPVGTGWPALGAGTAPITVTIQAGFEDGKVPAGIVQALKMLVAYFFEDRAGEDEPPAPAAALLRPHRLQLI